jgi:hypothetical protein
MFSREGAKARRREKQLKSYRLQTELFYQGSPPACALHADRRNTQARPNPNRREEQAKKTFWLFFAPSV